MGGSAADRFSAPPPDSLSAPGGGEGWGEVGDSRALADTHLTLPVASQRVPSLSALKGGEGLLANARYSFSSIASALETAYSPGCSTLSALTTPFSTSIA